LGFPEIGSPLAASSVPRLGGKKIWIQAAKSLKNIAKYEKKKWYDLHFT
jgi:hypothetical protein